MRKAQRKAKAKTAARKRGIVQAVKALLKKTNPSAKISGARVVKLTGGVLKITPIKANASQYGSPMGGARFMVLMDGVESGFETTRKAAEWKAKQLRAGLPSNARARVSIRKVYIGMKGQ